MANRRSFPHALFICLKRRTSESPIPPYSKAIRLELAQNAQAVARVTCLNLVLTMGLPAAASKPLQISVERLFKVPAAVPLNITPTRIWSIGNYAIGASFSDGHQSGIYTFGHLRGMTSAEVEDV